MQKKSRKNYVRIRSTTVVKTKINKFNKKLLVRQLMQNLKKN